MAFEALVLAWDGKPVPQRDDRTGVEVDQEALWMAVHYALSDIDSCISLYEVTEDLGTLVLLDKDGREVADV